MNYCIIQNRMGASYVPMILSRNKYDSIYRPYFQSDGSIKLNFPPTIIGWYDSIEEAKQALK